MSAEATEVLAVAAGLNKTGAAGAQAVTIIAEASQVVDLERRAAVEFR